MSHPFGILSSKSCIFLPRCSRHPPLLSSIVTCSRSHIIPVLARIFDMSTPHPRSPSPTSPPSRELDDTQLDDSEPPTTSEAKHGFKIYRTDYSDETKWERFMTYLSAQVQARMEEQNLAHEIPNIDWAIESSPDLARASEEDIRRYVARLTKLTSHPHY